MIIPWNTDAPLYHYPLATGGLIAANVLIYTSAGAISNPDDLILQYGGLHPLQWVTSNFMHADIFHLVGNMIFLWSFGLIIEGKVGWAWFLGIFFGIGIVECALEQLLTLGLTGGSMGASAIIFGLVAIALVWAPQNELNVFVWLWRPRLYDVPILIYSAFTIGFQFLLSLFSGLQPSAAALHTSGALLGAGIGIAMVKLDLVDCEGWDIFSVIAGKAGEKQQPKLSEADRREQQSAADAKRDAAQLHFRDHLAAGRATAALALDERMSQTLPGWALDEAALLALIGALHQEQAFAASIGPMRRYLDRFSSQADVIRLKLAHVLIQNEHRPSQALQVLSKLPPALPDKLQSLRARLEAEAHKQAEDVIEVEAEDW